MKRFFKKWQTILTVVLALLVLVLVPATALAQTSNEAKPGATPALKGALAMVAPRVVAAGSEMQLTVFLRVNQEPVPGVGIWAVNKDNIEALKKEIAALRDKAGANAASADYEAVVSAHGNAIGRTGTDGKLKHTFNDAGDYVLIAAKNGYFPDFSVLAVRNTIRALTIEAPKHALPGEAVTITVTQRGTNDAVKDAGVWAFSRDTAEALKAKLAEVREANKANIQDVNWESELKTFGGTFLGTTNGDGKIKHTFTEGLYFLIAIKPGYIPGGTAIAIKSLPQALALQTPGKAPVNEKVTLTVTQKGTEDGVKDAAIWAIKPEKVEALKAKVAEVKEANKADIQSVNWGPIVKDFGTLLGTTNGDGKLNYTFDAAGRYLLIAVKPSYIPAYGGIAITTPPDDSEISQHPETSYTRQTEYNLTG